jgi:hypothetical protein
MITPLSIMHPKAQSANPIFSNNTPNKIKEIHMEIVRRVTMGIRSSSVFLVFVKDMKIPSIKSKIISA